MTRDMWVGALVERCTTARGGRSRASVCVCVCVQQASSEHENAKQKATVTQTHTERQRGKKREQQQQEEQRCLIYRLSALAAAAAALICLASLSLGSSCRVVSCPACLARLAVCALGSALFLAVFSASQGQGPSLPSLPLPLPHSRSSRYESADTTAAAHRMQPRGYHHTCAALEHRSLSAALSAISRSHTPAMFQ